MYTEDDIRAAYRTAVTRAPDPDAVLTAVRQRHGAGTAPQRRGRRRIAARWIAPLAAAAAVAAVSLVTTSIATGTGGHRDGSGTVAPGGADHNTGLPAYYVAITSPTRQSGLVTAIRDTRSGATLATVRRPQGFSFFKVGAAASGDSFVLAANSHGRGNRFYLLHFNHATRATNLTLLPIPSTNLVDELALSPDGTEVAIAADGRTQSQLRIYSTSGRLIRRWQDPGGIFLTAGQPCLSWAASGYLAFSWSTITRNETAADGIRLIRATAPSGSLVGASRLVVPSKSAEITSFALSGNGTTIAAVVALTNRQVVIATTFAEFSAVTGKLTRQFWRSPQNITGAIYWSNWTGSKLIAVAPVPRTSRSPRWPLGVFTGDRFTLLPRPAQSWFALAF
jgi:hypothetical protein